MASSFCTRIGKCLSPATIYRLMRFYMWLQLRLSRALQSLKWLVTYCRNRIKYNALNRREKDNLIFNLNRPTYYPLRRTYTFFDHAAELDLLHQQSFAWKTVYNKIELYQCKCYKWRHGLNEKEQLLYMQIFAFFTIRDETLTQYDVFNMLITNIKMPELRALYVTQASKEILHAQLYGVVQQELLPKEVEQWMVSNEALDSPPMRTKHEWAIKWVVGTPFTVRLMFELIRLYFWNACAYSVFAILEKNNILSKLMPVNALVKQDLNMYHNYQARILCDYFNFNTRTDLQDIFLEITEGAYAVEMAFADYFAAIEAKTKEGNTSVYFTRECLVKEMQAKYDSLLELVHLPRKYSSNCSTTTKQKSL